MKLNRIFLNLTIRMKLLIAFSSILLLSVILLLTTLSAVNRILSYKDLNEQMDQLNLKFQDLEAGARAFIQDSFKERDFIENGRSAHLLELNAIYSSIQSSIQKLKESPHLSQESLKVNIEGLEGEIANYYLDFQDLLILLKERGFRDYGVEGSLRKAIHNVENSDFPFDKAQMLMLRRHEKDFFLRKDLSYVKRYEELVDVFKDNINSLDTKQNISLAIQKAEVFKLVDEYHYEFSRIVDLEKQIGLSQHDGLKGQLNSIAASVSPEIDKLNQLIKATSQKLIENTVLLLFAIFAFQFLIGLILVLFYSKVFTTSIKEIKAAAISLSEGKFPDKMKYLSRDEIAQTKKAFNNLIKRIQTAVDFSNRLGNGELKTTYNAKYSKDVLAHSLVNMQEKLIRAEQEQAKVNWSNQGMVLFNEILKKEIDDLEEFGDQVLRLLIKYVKANQGALFLLKKEDQKEYLQRIASYAYGKKKYVEQRMEIGTSLTGECVLERNTIYITDIPKGYHRITSGLGEREPVNLLIVPIMTHQQVIGVLELASFQQFEEYEVNFIEKLSESLAGLFVSKENMNEIKKLLEESQHKAQMLAAQEEELRQNSEELKAMQEDMQHKTAKLEEENIRLKAVNIDFEMKI